jgi:signal transduction histidine kinase
MESVGKLAAGISHEINTPAQFIKDNLTFLNNSLSSIKELINKYQQLSNLPNMKTDCKSHFAEIEEFIDNEDIHYLLEDIPVALDQSKQGIERIVQIVSAMKEFASADADSQLHVDVNESISNTLIISKNRWKNILKVETDFEKDLPLIPCYAAKINNVFLEMILNSCDAVVKRFINDDQKQGHLKIITRLKSDHLEIKFIDNGAGIEKKIANRVYDPFFTTKTVGQGTGQGLTTVYDIIVNKHSGELFFESDTNNGTTFFVRLPLGGRDSSHNIITEGIY